MIAAGKGPFELDVNELFKGTEANVFQVHRFTIDLFEHSRARNRPGTMRKMGHWRRGQWLARREHGASHCNLQPAVGTVEDVVAKVQLKGENAVHDIDILSRDRFADLAAAVEIVV